MLYNALLLIYLILYIPKALYEYVFLKKKKKDLLTRLGIKKYHFNSLNKKPIIWLHAVSLGETKTAASLLRRLKSEYPSSYIIISNTTQTGHDEAKKSLFLADSFVFFPIDLSFVIKRIFSQINPDLIIFIETDLWLNFMKEAKKNNSKIIVVSAKMSEKSHKRWSKFSFFAKKMFSYVDLILPQNELYKTRYASFIKKEKLKICGNLKFVNNIKKYPSNYLQEWKARLGADNKFIITIASTHEHEELLILNEIKDLSNIKILIVPRHPERFNRVYNQVKKIISCSLLNDLSNKNVNVIVVNQMGLLNTLYQISNLAIVGGSYINRVGGHNILEPAFVNTPVFFGPFMHTQFELKDIILKAQCGKQLELKDLKQATLKYMQDNSFKQTLRNNCLLLNKISENILQDTLDNIKKLILKS